MIKKVQTDKIDFDITNWSDKPFLYVVHLGRITEQQLQEITNWCEIHVTEQVWIRVHGYFGFRFLFVNPADATYFKLRWLGDGT